MMAASHYRLPRQYYLGVMDTPSRFAGNERYVDVCSDGEGCGAPGNEGTRVSDEISIFPFVGSLDFVFPLAVVSCGNLR